MSSRASAITPAGIVLSQPTRQTSPSKRWPATTSSIESAITSREISEARIPVVPIETPSETAIVLNSIGVPPAARIPSLTWRASMRWLRLHGIVSIQVVATPTSGRARSSSVKPTALSIARAGARSTPSVSAALRRLAGSVGLARRRSWRAPDLGRGRRLEVVAVAAGARRARRARRPRGGGRARSGKRSRARRRPRPRASGRAQTTTDGPEPESVDADRAGRRARAQLGEHGRVGDPEGLVQPVVEGRGEQLGVARGERGAEQRRRGGRGGRLLVAQELRQPRARLARVDARRAGRRRPRCSGSSVGDPRRAGALARLPAEADAAARARRRGCRRGPRAACPARAAGRARARAR